MDMQGRSSAPLDGRSNAGRRSHTGFQAQLYSARSPAKGFASSRISTYRPLGTPDVKRDGSLLPKIGKLYHSQCSQNRGEFEDIQADFVLPMRLRECYWNGERWCGTPFLPRLASARNGYAYLHDKIRASNKHLIACRSACISPGIFHSESKFSASLRNGLVTERPSCGVIPPSAVTDASLRQLSNILDKETRFKAVQNNLNEHSKQIGNAIDSTRPFSYTRQFMSLKHLSPARQSWDNRPTDSPHRIEAFRKGLEVHQWYDELIGMMFLGNRSPSKPELEILSYIAKILEAGLPFDTDDYVKLLKHLEKIGTDLNDYATSQAMIHIRLALDIPDEALLEGYLRTCHTIPAFLASIDVPNNYSRLLSRTRVHEVTT